MKKTTTYKCDRCDTGEVKQVYTETKNHITVNVGKCNTCKYPHGIKSISKLIEVLHYHGSQPATI